MLFHDCPCQTYSIENLMTDKKLSIILKNIFINERLYFYRHFCPLVRIGWVQLLDERYLDLKQVLS